MTDQLEDRLDAIPHQTLDLMGTNDDPRDNPPHRPEFSIWASFLDDEGGAHVSLAMMPLWAQPIRYADLTPVEARKLARMLSEMADAIDREVGP